MATYDSFFSSETLDHRNEDDEQFAQLLTNVAGIDCSAGLTAPGPWRVEVKPQWQKEPNDYGPLSFPKPIPLGGYGITDNVASNPTNNAMPKPSGSQDTPEPQSFTKQQILQLNNIGQRNKMAMDPGYNPHYRFDKTSDTERRISVKPNTANDENTVFPKALATAITATQQSGLPPAEFIRRLCGALGLDEEDLKKKDPKHSGGGTLA